MKDLRARLVIVEDIMGSGKSTTARCIATRLERAGQPARAVTETTEPHPVRGTDGLRHWYQPWLDTTPAGLAERSPAKRPPSSPPSKRSLQRMSWMANSFTVKLQALYSRRLGLEGLDGLIALYRDHRALTDDLYIRLCLPKPAIENSRREWAGYCERIMQELFGDRREAI